ncbi:hypothetical protein BU16DRAFT_530649 [Lophium mytilinum]|uniref:Hydrophobin n=1 Tax=Lophium mytilinum TaxID=390894 RepID=A0A6A6QHG7_9PEZI|nr:hypothetical protein BU16DRAFT_530649 [Lophium mytilinum]
MRFSILTVAAFVGASMALPNMLDRRIVFTCPADNIYAVCCPSTPGGLPTITSDVGCNAAAAVSDSSCAVRVCCDSIATEKVDGGRVSTGTDCVLA